MVVIIGEVFSLTPPSPAGRNVPSVLAKRKLDSACELADFTKPINGCSFSRREKVRMRENVILERRKRRKAKPNPAFAKAK
jgi:hypothetical protein